jgi:hypothetical protein
MPRKMEKALKRSARKKGFRKGSKRHGAYVYGTMQKKTDWKPGRKKKRKCR